MTIRTLPAALVIAAWLAPLGATAEGPDAVSQYVPTGWQLDEAPVQARGIPKNKAKAQQAGADQPDQPKKLTKQQVRKQNIDRADQMAGSLDHDSLGATLRIEQTYARVRASRQKAGQDASEEVIDEEVKVRENIRKKLKPSMEADGLTGEEREREFDARVESELASMRLEAQRVMRASKNQNPSELDSLKLINIKLINTSKEQNLSWSQLQKLAIGRKEGREAAITQGGRNANPTLKIKRKPMNEDGAPGDGAPADAPTPAPAPKAQKRMQSPAHTAKLKRLHQQERLATGSDYDAQISRLDRQAQALGLKAAKAKLQRLPAAPVRQPPGEAEKNEAQ